MSDSEPWKERRMIRGRWREPEDARAGARADKPISVKLTEPELKAFDAQIAKVGLKRNRALRIAARRIGGFLEMDQAALDELRYIARQIGGIATNINQMARVTHVTKEPDYEKFLQERRDLGQDMARLESLLQRLLNVGQRRTDGLRRLEDAAGQ